MVRNKILIINRMRISKQKNSHKSLKESKTIKDTMGNWKENKIETIKNKNRDNTPVYNFGETH